MIQFRFLSSKTWGRLDFDFKSLAHIFPLFVEKFTKKTQFHLAIKDAKQNLHKIAKSRNVCSRRHIHEFAATFFPIFSLERIFVDLSNGKK